MSAKRSPGIRPGSFWTLFNRPGGWFFFLGVLVLCAGMLFLQHLQVKRYQERPWAESFTLPQPEYVKLLSMGYDAWLADYFYLRAIQGFGGAFRSRGGDRDAYEPVFNYFDVISELDPRFIEAYGFGNLVMGDEGGHQDLALEYLKKGQQNNWRTFLPWHEAAYIKVYQLKEPDLEARYFIRQAGKSHDAPTWAERLEGFVLEQEGQFPMAVLRWLEAYAEAIDNGDEVVEAIAERRIEAVINSWHLSILRHAVEEFIRKEGRNPESLEEVADNGYLPPVSIVDSPLLLENVEIARASGQPVHPLIEQIFDFSHVEKAGILENLAEPSPFVLMCSPIEDIPQVVSRDLLITATEEALRRYREYIAKVREETGAYPESIDGVIIPGWGFHVPDPYCLGWDYDPETGSLRSLGNPGL